MVSPDMTRCRMEPTKRKAFCGMAPTRWTVDLVIASDRLIWNSSGEAYVPTDIMIMVMMVSAQPITQTY